MAQDKPKVTAAATMGGSNALMSDEESELKQEQGDDSPSQGTECDGTGSALSLEERVSMLEADLEKYKSQYLRALADAENAKGMARKQVEDNRKFAVSNFAKDILVVADNLSRALMAAPATARAANKSLDTLAVGVELTAKELHSALNRYNIKKVNSLNQVFDPNVHQAMQEVWRSDVPTGTVLQVHQDAYTIQDRLLRPAMVVVSKDGTSHEPQDTVVSRENDVGGETKAEPSDSEHAVDQSI